LRLKTGTESQIIAEGFFLTPPWKTTGLHSFASFLNYKQVKFRWPNYCSVSWMIVDWCLSGEGKFFAITLFFESQTRMGSVIKKEI